MGLRANPHETDRAACIIRVASFAPYIKYIKKGGTLPERYCAAPGLLSTVIDSTSFSLTRTC